MDDRSPLHDMSTHSHHSHHSHHSYSGMGHGHPGVPGGPPIGGGPSMGGPTGGRRDSDLSDAFLSPEAYRATQAVEFIAEHLRNEDEYVQVQYLFFYFILAVQWQCLKFLNKCLVFTAIGEIVPHLLQLALFRTQNLKRSADCNQKSIFLQNETFWKRN